MTNTPPGPTPFDATAFAALFRQRLPEFQLAWSLFQVRNLSRLREGLGELDDLLLLLALTVGPAIADARKRGVRWDDEEGPWSDEQPPPTNAVRLAQMTNIPRETVRRRMLAMASRGWVEQSGPPRREWRLAIGADGWPRVRRDLEPFHGHFLQDMARLLAQWDRFAREEGWEGLTQPRPRANGPGAR